MTHAQSFAQMVEATHDSIEGRLAEVLAADDGRGAHETHRCVDAFVATTSRHLSAVDEVLLPAVRSRVPDGGHQATEYLHAARRLESDLCLLKARLYGEAHAVHLSWPELLQQTRQDLSRHDSLEAALAEALRKTAGDGQDLDDLALDLYVAELRAPTRPHPYLPHSGALGRVARRLWARADRFWDSTQGRMIPEPKRPPQHRHDSLLAQYMVADPHFDGTAALMEHRRRHGEEV